MGNYVQRAHSAENARNVTNITIRSKTKFRKRSISSYPSQKYFNIRLEGIIIRRAFSLSSIDDSFRLKRFPLVEPLLSESEIIKLQMLQESCRTQGSEQVSSAINIGSSNKHEPPATVEQQTVREDKQGLEMIEGPNGVELNRKGNKKLIIDELINKHKRIDNSERLYASMSKISGIKNGVQLKNKQNHKKEATMKKYAEKQNVDNRTTKKGVSVKSREEVLGSKFTKSTRQSIKKHSKKSAVSEKVSINVKSVNNIIPADILLPKSENKVPKERDIKSSKTHMSSPVNTVSTEKDQESKSKSLNNTPEKSGRKTKTLNKHSNKDSSSKGISEYSDTVNKSSRKKRDDKVRLEREANEHSTGKSSPSISSPANLERQHVAKGDDSKLYTGQEKVNKITKSSENKKTDIKRKSYSDTSKKPSKRTLSEAEGQVKDMSSSRVQSKSNKRPFTDHYDKSLENKFSKGSQRDRKMSSEHGYVIYYILSDPSFISVGWTLPAVDKIVSNLLTFKTTPANPRMYCFTPRSEIKHYPDGNVAVNMRVDGSGEVYYPSGQVAIRVNGMRLAVFSDPSKEVVGRSTRLLGVFDSLGNGVVYDRRGERKLVFDQLQGELHDRSKGTRYRWRWRDYDSILMQRIRGTLDYVAQERSKVVKASAPAVTPRGFNSPEGPTSNAPLPKSVAAELPLSVSKAPNSKKDVSYNIPKPIFLKISDETALRILGQDKVVLKFSVGKVSYAFDMGIAVDPERIERMDLLAPDKKYEVPCIFTDLLHLSSSLEQLCQS